MQPKSVLLDMAVLVSIIMLPLFYLLKKQIRREGPTLGLSSIWFFWVAPFAVLRIHQELYPRSFFRSIYRGLWFIASSLYVLGVIQLIVNHLRTARSLPN